MASIRDFVFGFRLEVIDHLSGVLKNVETRIKGLNEAVSNTSHWREAGQNLAVVGGAVAGAGAVVGYGLKQAVDAAADMQAVAAHVQTAMSDGLDTQKHLTEAMATSQQLAVSSGLAAKQEAEAYYIARSNMLDHGQALAAIDVATKLTIGTTESLADAQENLAPTTRLLTTMFENFGDKSKDPNKQIAMFADTLANLQTKFAFRDITELNYALQYAVPLAKSAGIAVNDMGAALALLSESGLHGAEAGTGFEELVSKFAAGKELRKFAALTATGGLDLKRSLGNIAASVNNLPAYEKALALHQFGFSERSIKGVALMLDKINQYGDVVNALDNSQGAAAQAAAVRMQAFDYQTGKLAQSWELLKEKIGEPLLVPLGHVVDLMSRAVNWVSAFAEANPKVVKFVVTFAAIAAGVAVVAGGVIALAGGIMVMASFAPAIAATLGAWALSIGIVGTGLAALAGTVAAFGLKVLTAWPSAEFWKKLGWNILKGIGAGMLSGVGYLLGPLGTVAKLIIDHFPHSPARLGPLRDLNKIRIVGTIADTIKTAPAALAMRRVATAVALAAPLIATPAFAAASTPAFAPAAFAARAAGNAPIVMTVNVTFNVTASADSPEFREELRRHGHELADALARQLDHEERRRY